jgi:hypothetical protein
MMRALTTYSGILLASLVAYCGSYVALRCAGMEFRANRHTTADGATIIKSRVSFGNGNHTFNRLARVVYFPMHRGEHAWLCWAGAIVVYE